MKMILMKFYNEAHTEWQALCHPFFLESVKLADAPPDDILPPDNSNF